MRGRFVARAAGLGCAGLMVLVLATPATAERGGTVGRMAAEDVAADCDDAGMNTAPAQPGGVKLSADVADGATVAPGQDIMLRLNWDPRQWSGQDLDMALACVQVKGALDPDLSSEERPTGNDGVFEYRLHVPDSIRPGCDICVQGFLAGMAANGGSQQVGSNSQCFMSGGPHPAASPAPAPPAAQPAPQPSAAASPAPSPVPAQVAGITASQPAPAPAQAAGPAPTLAPATLPEGELPRTGAATRVATTGGGLTLAFGGLAVMGGAGRRTRRRIVA